jgi:hypothetical protein
MTTWTEGDASRDLQHETLTDLALGEEHGEPKLIVGLVNLAGSSSSASRS